MTEELTPLDADVLAVLEQAKPVPAMPVGAHDRVWSAVEARVALVPGAASGGTAPVAPPTGGIGGPAGWIARNPWLSVASALILGGAVGAGVRGKPEVQFVTVVERPAPVPTRPTPTASTSLPWTEVAPPEPAAPVVPPSAVPTGPTASAGQELAAESAVLDIARTAIARGQADHAIAAVDRHAATFPHGMLREEREALGVKALVLAGRGDEARTRAARFRTRYPESLFLPAIDSSLRSLP